MQALAFARMGSRERAVGILRRLQAEDHQDEETLGLLARTYKDLWRKSGGMADLDQAHRAYAQGFELSHESYWLGINAATLAFVKGEKQEARALASQVRTICDGRLASDSGDERYWLVATLAESYLLLGSLPEAEKFYSQAGELGQERLGDVITTWASARLILSSGPPAGRAAIEQALRVPNVVVFTGHRVDPPEASSPRFPEAATGQVREQIRVHLLDTRARFGYSSAASGSDILFLEAMQAAGGRTYVVLPCDESQFIRESVASSGEHWVNRFHAVKERATEVILASQERLNLGSVGYDFSNELLYGLAKIRARQIGAELIHVAVWDGRESNRRGGTADIVNRWEKRTADIIIVNPYPEAVSADASVARLSATDDHTAQSGVFLPEFQSAIRCMLFADVYHFSRLGEDQIPAFIQHFMGPIADLVRQTTPPPLFQNTWGDGLYIVFSTVAEGGDFALKLARRVADIDRTSLGLPADMTLRISLHAGPVYQYKDQIIGQMNYIGSHVNRAARIEPVTPPGQVYVTDAFAALGELEAPGRFLFDYVGKVSLAKGFGEFPTYNMQPGELPRALLTSIRTAPLYPPA